MKIHIAIPCFGGLQQAQNSRSVALLTHVLKANDIDWALDYELHESLVQRARNSLSHRFMASDATHILFIDSDIDFDGRIVLGMLGADKPLVCAAYPKKTIDEQALKGAFARGESKPFDHAANYAINVLPGELTDHNTIESTVTSDNGCVPILDAPTGFMLVRREVFEQMVAAHPETLYYSDSHLNRGEAMHAFFDCAIEDERGGIVERLRRAIGSISLTLDEQSYSYLSYAKEIRRLETLLRDALIPKNGRYLSEDYLFSRRWQRLGGTVWLFLHAKLGHVGSFTYRGNLFTTFRPELDSAASSGSATTASGGATEWCDIPSLPDSDPQKRWHLYRYEWAAKHLKGNNVANAAAGSGYGSKILAANGAYVCGYDRSLEACKIARAAGLRQIHVNDLHDCYMSDHHSVVSLETIEHLERPWEWIGNLAKSVKELIISVPVIPTKHTNPFHLHDFTTNDVMYKLADLGWEITDSEYQDEYQPKAVLLLRAER